MSQARVLWTLSGSGPSPTLSANGVSASINLTSVNDVWLAVFAAGASTGTTPTLDVQLDVQDADGNWFPQIAKITQITAGPGRGTAVAGLHMPNVTGTSTAIVLPLVGRVAWTVGGTTPVFPGVSIALIGR
jgi:hypothetical protein